jgi:hypothetical protein
MKLRCTLCRGSFTWVVKDGYPDFCPLCGERIGIEDRGDNGVVMPFIRSAKMTANDKVYRDIEKGSEARVGYAAEVAGATREDMAALKITDMRDNMRAGDIAAKEADGAMERLQKMTPMQVGFQANGQGYSDGIAQGAVALPNGQVITGIEPNAGARAARRVARKMQGW